LTFKKKIVIVNKNKDNMITKTGKQLTKENYMNYNVVYGTVDNKNPKSLYLTISAWSELKNPEITNYSACIRQLTKEIKTKLHNELDSNIFQVNRTIVDFDMRESGIEYGKRSYMNCEVTLFQKNSFKLQEKIIQENLDKISHNILCEVLDDATCFNFYKTNK
jgi:hypothetical protein